MGLYDQFLEDAPKQKKQTDYSQFLESAPAPPKKAKPAASYAQFLEDDTQGNRMQAQRQQAERQAAGQEQTMGIARQLAPAVNPLLAPLTVWTSPLVMGALNQGTQTMAPAAREIFATERKDDLAGNLGPATRARLQEQGRTPTQHLESIKPTGTNDALDNPILKRALGAMVPGYGTVAAEFVPSDTIRDQLGNMRDAAEYLTGAQLHDDKDNFGPLTQRGLDRRGQTMQQRQAQILQAEQAQTGGGVEGWAARNLPIPTNLNAETTFDVGREAGMSPEIALATEAVMDPQNIIEALPVARLAGLGRNLTRSLGVGDDLAEAFARGVDDTAAELGQRADITSAAPRRLRTAEQANAERSSPYSQFLEDDATPALPTAQEAAQRRVIQMEQEDAQQAALKARRAEIEAQERLADLSPEPSPGLVTVGRQQGPAPAIEVAGARGPIRETVSPNREAEVAEQIAEGQAREAEILARRQVELQQQPTSSTLEIPGQTPSAPGRIVLPGEEATGPAGRLIVPEGAATPQTPAANRYSQFLEDEVSPGTPGRKVTLGEEPQVKSESTVAKVTQDPDDYINRRAFGEVPESPVYNDLQRVQRELADVEAERMRVERQGAGQLSREARAANMKQSDALRADAQRLQAQQDQLRQTAAQDAAQFRQAYRRGEATLPGPASLEQGYAPRAMQMGTPQPRPPQPGPAGTPPNQTALVPSPSPAQLPPRKTLGDVIRTALGRPEPGQVKNVPQMIRNAAKTLEKMTGAKGVYGLGRSASSKTPARFLSGQNLIEIKRGNLRGWWHEVGHTFDEMAAKVGSAGKARPEGKFSRRSDLTSELDTLGSQGDSSWKPGMDELRRRQEGMAEFTRLWFENPEEARRLAPKTFDAYEKHLDELGDLGSEWRQHQAEMELWMTSDKAARAMAHVVERPDQKWRVGTLSETVAGLVNRYHPLKALDEVAAAFKGVKMLSPEDSMHVQARLMKNLSNLKIQEFQNQLKQALEPINAMGHKASAAFQKWLVARHAVEMEKAGLATGRPLDEWEALVQAYDTPEFRQAADDLAAWQKSVNQYAIDEGNLDPLAVEGWEQKWKHYVPTNRELENVIGQVDPKPGFAGSGAKALKPGRGPGAWLHGKKGGQQAIYEPIETMLQNMQSTVYSTERNRMGKMLLRKLDEDTEGLGQFVREIEPGDKAGRRTVTFRDGDPASGAFRERTLEFTNEELFKAYTAMDEKSFGIVTRILGAPAQLLRYGATRIRLPFVLNNFERDTVGSALNSRVGSFPLAQSLDGLFTVIRSYAGDQAAKDVVEAFAKSGGKQGIDERYADPTSARKMYRDVLSSLSPTARALTIVPKPLQAGVKGVGTVIKSPITLLEYLSDLSEQATRLGEFKNARKFYAEQNPDWSQKAIDQQAGFEAMDLLDFDMRGNNEIVRWLRQIIPFSGSSMTGTYRTLQAMRENPKMFVAKSMGFLAIPTLGLYAMNRNNPYYWELTQQDRDSHWHIPMVEPLAKMLGITNPAEKFIRIKKPFLMGHIGGALWERAAQLMFEKDPKAFDGFAEAILTQSLPATVDDMGGPGLRMISEINNNYDSFRKRDIEPDWLRKGPGEIAPYQRSDEYSTITSRLFSQALAKIPGAPKFSPLQLDHIVRGMTGGGGEAVLKGRLFGNIPGLNRIGVDPLLSAATGMEEAKASRQQYLGQVPSEGRHESEDRFFKRLSALRQTVNDPANPEAKKMRGKLAQYENTEKRLKGYYKQRANAKDETQRARINRLIVRETERLEPPTGRQKELRQGAKPRE